MKKFILRSIFGAALIMCAPCVLHAWNISWSEGLVNFVPSFKTAWVHYFSVGNIVVSLLTAMVLQPVFSFLGWISGKLPSRRKRA